MNATLPFRDVLDAIEQLSSDEQDTLIDIVQKRRSEKARQRLIAEVEASRKEFEEGRGKTGSVEDIIKEILS